MVSPQPLYSSLLRAGPMLVLLSLAGIGSTSARVEGSTPEPAEECDYGITLALVGDTAKAESVFISLLSHAPGDARALNNLGNVALLRGRCEVGLSFYERALNSDSTDPGITLNAATALMILGDQEAALEAASDGLRMAGGPGPAASLLGLRYDGDMPTWPKGDKRTYLSKDEVLSLLGVAAGKVPADSVQTQTKAKGKGGPKGRGRTPVWRMAGPRAGDAEDTAAVVYWKR